ncbi:MAG: hypothetical protein AAB604_03055 [Patescibacteria group bacterium]
MVFLAISYFLVVSGYFLLAIGYALATDYSGSSFIIRDPVISDGGNRSTSDNFELYSSMGQIAAGTSTSSNFEVRSGFLYYPQKSVCGAFSGNAQVGLHWSPTTGASTYDVGQATASGGPYTFTAIGNVFGTVRTGLTNGTAYYFIMRGKDSAGNTIATSSEVSATPTSSYYGVKTNEYGAAASSTTYKYSNDISVTLSFPANMLSTSESLLFSQYALSEAAAVADMPLPSGKVAGNTFYNFSFAKKHDGNSLSSLDSAVTVTFTYTDDDISGIDESTLAAYRWNGSSWAAISGSSVNTTTNTVTMSTASFGNFGLMGSAPATTAASTPSPGGGGILFQLSEFYRLPVAERVRLRDQLPILLPPLTPAVSCIFATDLNCDRVVDMKDLSIFLFDEGEDVSRADFNHDEVVDLKDLSVLFSEWTEPLITFTYNPRSVSARNEETPQEHTPTMEKISKKEAQQQLALIHGRPAQAVLLSRVEKAIKTVWYGIVNIWQRFSSFFF